MDQILITDAVRLLNSSTSLLLVLPSQPSIDVTASAFAIAAGLRQQPKRVTIFSSGYQAPIAHSFLPTTTPILSELTNLREFVIRVGLGTATLDSLRYETTPTELQLFLTPKRGYFESKDVQLSAGTFAYDAILTIGVSSLAALGAIAEDHREFFSHTPTITLDHQATHQQYGQVNIIDLVATSTSEVALNLLNGLSGFHMDEPIATTLLAGIMSNTNGFQATSVTPKALAAASTLLSAGARRDDVVRNLYQTKTVPVLRLWGKALSRLQLDPATGVAHTTVTQDDLRQTQTDESAALGLLDELLAAAQEAVVALLIESPTGTDAHVVIRDSHRAANFPEQARAVTPQYTQIALNLPPTQSLQTVLGWWKAAVPEA